MAIGLLPLLGRRGGELLRRKLCMTMTTNTFPFPKEDNFSEEGLVDLLPELQGLGRLGEGQPEIPAQLHGDGQRRPVLPLRPGPPSLPFSTRTQPSSKKLYSSCWKREGTVVMAILFCWEREGVVIIVIQSLLLKSSPFLGKARSGDHGHLGPSSQGLPSSAGEREGWWSWSYSFIFWKREGAMVMVIHNLLLRMCPPPLGQSEPAQLTTPLLSYMKKNAFQRNAVYDHDHHPFPFQKRRTGQELI